MAGEVRLCSVDRPQTPGSVRHGVACIPDKGDLKKGRLEAHWGVLISGTSPVNS